jgi:hypothetical protein
MRFEVLTAVKMSMLVLWVVTPFRLAGRYRRFGETYCLHLKGCKWRQYFPLKNYHPPTSPHGVTTQKTNIDKVIQSVLVWTKVLILL